MDQSLKNRFRTRLIPDDTLRLVIFSTLAPSLRPPEGRSAAEAIAAYREDLPRCLRNCFPRAPTPEPILPPTPSSSSAPTGSDSKRSLKRPSCPPSLQPSFLPTRAPFCAPCAEKPRPRRCPRPSPIRPNSDLNRSSCSDDVILAPPLKHERLVTGCLGRRALCIRSSHSLHGSFDPCMNAFAKS